MPTKKSKSSSLKPVKHTLPKPTEETVPMTFRLPESLKERLDYFAESKDLKSSNLLRHILEEFLDAQGA